MKSDTHPSYYTEAKVICACGHTFTVGSTTEEINVELCSHCHPFFTGKQKLVDTARRLEKFAERATKKATTATGKKAKTVRRASKKAASAA